MEQKLTDDQKRLIEQNHNLIYGYLSLNNLNFEDWYDVAVFGLIKAAIKYDNSKGEFSTCAYYWINSCVNKEYRKLNCTKKRIQENNMLSLNNKKYDEDNKDEFINTIPDYDYDISNEVIHNIIYENLIKKCKKDKERQVIELFCQGYSIADIKRITNISRITIKKYQTKAITYLKGELK